MIVFLLGLGLLSVYNCINMCTVYIVIVGTSSLPEST